MGAQEMKPDDFMGAWRLVRWEQIEDGEPIGKFPMGEDAEGLIIYEPGGHMSGFLSRAGWKDMDPSLESYNIDFFAYGGTWRIDGNRVEHHVQFASFPRWIGGTQVRHATLKDGYLILEVPESSSAAPDGPRKFRLTWERP